MKKVLVKYPVKLGYSDMRALVVHHKEREEKKEGG